LTARLGAVLLAVAAVAYSAWLIELFLPDRLSLLNAYVSEYSANGQPYRTLFRTTDMISAGCLLLAAFSVGRTVRDSRWVVIGLAVLGVAVLADANFTLDCASALSEACREAKEQGAVSFADHMHIVTSVLSVAGMAIALLGAERLARRKALPRVALGIVGVTSLAIVLLDPFGRYAAGFLRFQLVTVGVALLCGARSLARVE
jgi:hypothetical protein